MDQSDPSAYTEEVGHARAHVDANGKGQKIAKAPLTFAQVFDLGSLSGSAFKSLSTVLLTGASTLQIPVPTKP